MAPNTARRVRSGTTGAASAFDFRCWAYREYTPTTTIVKPMKIQTSRDTAASSPTKRTKPTASGPPEPDFFLRPIALAPSSLTGGYQRLGEREPARCGEKRLKCDPDGGWRPFRGQSESQSAPSELSPSGQIRRPGVAAGIVEHPTAATVQHNDAHFWVVGPAKFVLHFVRRRRHMRRGIYDDGAAPLPRVNGGEPGDHGSHCSLRNRCSARRLRRGCIHRSPRN